MLFFIKMSSILLSYHPTCTSPTGDIALLRTISQERYGNSLFQDCTHSRKKDYWEFFSGLPYPSPSLTWCNRKLYILLSSSSSLFSVRNSIALGSDFPIPFMALLQAFWYSVSILVRPDAPMSSPSGSFKVLSGLPWGFELAAWK